MRWQYCAQPPDREPALRLRARRTRSSASCSRSGTRSRSSSTTRTSPASSRRSPTSTAARRSSAPLDRWLVARTHAARARGDRGVRGDADGRRDRARSRRSSTTSRTGTSAARAGASGTRTRPRSARSGTRSCSRCARSSPVMPFLTEHLWRNLVAGRRRRSIFLAGWPEVAGARPRAARRDRGACAAWSSSAARRARRRG